mmetsp:Transcript_39800/g.102507  ORF Transcript_39800/g.102507 Transcript_39800/m.102507 type:complete len:162 (-) Transcript_39800:6913-7398(-)
MTKKRLSPKKRYWEEGDRIGQMVLRFLLFFFLLVCFFLGGEGESEGTVASCETTQKVFLFPFPFFLSLSFFLCALVFADSFSVLSLKGKPKEEENHFLLCWTPLFCLSVFFFQLRFVQRRLLIRSRDNPSTLDVSCPDPNLDVIDSISPFVGPSKQTTTFL